MCVSLTGRFELTRRFSTALTGPLTRHNRPPNPNTNHSLVFSILYHINQVDRANTKPLCKPEIALVSTPSGPSCRLVLLPYGSHGHDSTRSPPSSQERSGPRILRGHTEHSGSQHAPGLNKTGSNAARSTRICVLRRSLSLHARPSESHGCSYSRLP